MIQMYVSKQGDVPAESRRIDGIFIKNVLTPLTEKGHTDTQTDRDTHTIQTSHTIFQIYLTGECFLLGNVQHLMDLLLWGK